MFEIEFSRKAEEDLRVRIKSSENENILWLSKDVSDRESFIGFIQLYSDKSTICLKRTGISASPIHINFMNFSYKAWKKQIINEWAFVAYLPIVVEHEEDIWKISGNAQLRTSIPQVLRAGLFHKELRVILSPFCKPNQTEFECLNRKGKKLQCHLLLAEIAADAREQKDLSHLMDGCQTAKPCCRCICDRRNMNDGRQYRSRSVVDTTKRRTRAQHLDEHFDLEMFNNSSERARKCKESKEIVLKEVSLSTGPSFYEETTFVPKSKTQNV